MVVMPREFEELANELEDEQKKAIPYVDFLSAIFLGQMYLKELSLYNVLRQTDKDNKGGVTIKEM